MLKQLKKYKNLLKKKNNTLLHKKSTIEIKKINLSVSKITAYQTYKLKKFTKIKPRKIILKSIKKELTKKEILAKYVLPENLSIFQLYKFEKVKSLLAKEAKNIFNEEQTNNNKKMINEEHTNDTKKRYQKYLENTKKIIKKKNILEKLKKKPSKKLNNLHIINIKASNNNTIYSVYNLSKKYLINAASTGHVGFKGSKRAMPYAAVMLSAKLANILIKQRIKNSIVILKGDGKGRKSIFKRINRKLSKIHKIVDKNLYSHNGCRLKKKRRI